MNRKMVAALAVAAAVLLLLPVLPGLLQRINGGGLQREYDLIKGRGEPTTLKELDAWYERPADNAAITYLKAFDARVELSPELKARLPWEQSGAALPPQGQPLPEQTRSAVQELVRLNSSALALLQEASTHPQCRYPVDIGKGYAVELPHLAKIRSAARLLGCRALLSADTGDMDGAVKSLTSLFALANSLESEPILISQLVRFACAQIGDDATTWAIRRAPVSESQSAQLAAALRPFAEESTFWRAMAGERCMLIGQWDGRMGPGIDGVIAALSALPRESRPNIDFDALRAHSRSAVYEKDLAHMLHIMDLVVQGAKLPPGQDGGVIQQARTLLNQTPQDYLLTKYPSSQVNDSDINTFLRSLEKRTQIVESSRVLAANMRGVGRR